MALNKESLRFTWAGLVRIVRQGTVDLAAGARDLFVRLVNFVESWLIDSPKAVYGASVTRILLAFTALGLLASNWSTRLYTFGSAGAWTADFQQPQTRLPRAWLFSLFQTVRDDDVVFTALYLLVAVLAVLLLVGYRVRLVLPVFLVMWVSLIETQNIVHDSGDHLFRIALTVLLFADTTKKWAIDSRRRVSVKATQSQNVLVRGFYGGRILPEWLRNLSHNLALVVLAFQVSVAYVAGALYKAGGEPWLDGTAIYGPLQVWQFSPWPEINELLILSGPFLAAVAYSTLIVQAFFPVMLVNKWTRRIALIVIMSFHLGIAVLLGIPWFSLAMIAADAIFIRDETWARLAAWMRKTFRGESDDVTAVTDDESSLPRRRALREESLSGGGVAGQPPAVQPPAVQPPVQQPPSEVPAVMPQRVPEPTQV